MSLNDLRHPDCRACDERERLNVGLMAENGELKKRLANSGLEKAAKAVESAPMAQYAADWIHAEPREVEQVLEGAAEALRDASLWDELDGSA